MEVKKICPICQKEFVITNSKDNARKYCFICSPADRKHDWTPVYRAMKHQLIIKRGGCCERCGYNKCEAALQFHHKDPKQKNFELSLKSGSHNWQDWIAEAEKCELLCANCHCEEHYLANPTVT